MHDLRQGVAEAIRKAGTGAALGRALNLSRQAVYQWDRIPSEHVIKVEEVTGVPRQRLRPDLYPAERPLVSEKETAQ